MITASVLCDYPHYPCSGLAIRANPERSNTEGKAGARRGVEPHGVAQANGGIFSVAPFFLADSLAPIPATVIFKAQTMPTRGLGAEWPSGDRRWARARGPTPGRAVHWGADQLPFLQGRCPRSFVWVPPPTLGRCPSHRERAEGMLRRDGGLIGCRRHGGRIQLSPMCRRSAHRSGWTAMRSCARAPSAAPPCRSGCG